MTLMAVALFHGSTSRSRAAAILAPAKFGMRPCGGNGKRATPSATSLSQTHCRAALLSAKSPAMTESGAARPGDSQGRKLPLQGSPAGSLAGVEIIKQSEDPVDVGVLVILNHIVESRLVPRNTCGHQSSEQWNRSRQLPIARSPAEAVGFLILDDLAPARGPPPERTLFPIACRHACAKRGRCGPFCDNAEATEKLSRSPG